MQSMGLMPCCCLQALVAASAHSSNNGITELNQHFAYKQCLPRTIPLVVLEQQPQAEHHTLAKNARPSASDQQPPLLNRNTLRLHLGHQKLLNYPPWAVELWARPQVHSGCSFQSKTV